MSRVAKTTVGAAASPNTRGLMVRALSRAGVCAARAVFNAAVPDVVKVAALVNIAGAAAGLARSLAKLRRIDPALVDQYVWDRADARAVLGRGRWLPTMVGTVPVPAVGLVAPEYLNGPAGGVSRPARGGAGGRVRRAAGGSNQPVLVGWPAAGGGR